MYEDMDLDDFGLPLNSKNEVRVLADKLVDKQLRMRLVCDVVVFFN
jgi:hypothetical protein